MQPHSSSGRRHPQPAGRPGRAGRAGGRRTVTIIRPTLIAPGAASTVGAAAAAIPSVSNGSSSSSSLPVASSSSSLPPVVARVVGEAMRGNVGACVQLIRDSLSPAEVDTRLDDEGTTLLRKACEYGSAEVVRELLAKGARVSEEPPSAAATSTVDGAATATPSKGSRGKGPNGKLSGARRASCLGVACSRGPEELVRMLAPRASAADRAECLRAILANPTTASPTGSGSGGASGGVGSVAVGSADGASASAKGAASAPLDEAAITRIAACLLQQQPQPQPGGSADTAVLGAQVQREASASASASASAVPQAQFSSSRSSLLHDAVNRGLNGVVELLLSHGFSDDLLSFDGDGLSPLQLAEKRHVLSLLRQTAREREEKRRRAQSEPRHGNHRHHHHHDEDDDDDDDNGGWSLFMGDEELPDGASDAYASSDELSYEPTFEDEEEEEEEEYTDDDEDEGDEENEEEDDDEEEEEDEDVRHGANGGSSRWGRAMVDASSVMHLRPLEADLRRSRGEVALDKDEGAEAVYERTIILLYRAMGVRSALFSEFGLLQIESKLVVLADYGVPRLLDALATPFNTAPWPATTTTTSSSGKSDASVPISSDGRSHIEGGDAKDAAKTKTKIDIEAVIRDAAKSRNRRLTPHTNAPDAHQHMAQETETAFVELGFVNNNAASRDFMDMLNLVAELRRSVDAPSSPPHIRDRRTRLFCGAMREPPRGVRGAAARAYALSHGEEVQLLSERAVRAIIWCLSSPCEDLDTSAIMEWAFILQNYTDIYTPVHCLSADVQEYYKQLVTQKEGKKAKKLSRGRKNKVSAPAAAAGEEEKGVHPVGFIQDGAPDWSADVNEVEQAVSSNPQDFYSCRLVLDADADPLRGLCHPAVAAQLLDNIGELGYMILLGITGQDWTGTSDADPNVLMDRDIDLFYNYLELINRVLIPRVFAIHQTSCRQQYHAQKKAEAPRSRRLLHMKRAAGAASSRGLVAKAEGAVPAPVDAHWGARGGSLLGDVAEALFGDILPLFWNLEMALSLLSGHVIEDQLLRLQAMISGVYMWEIWELVTSHEGVLHQTAQKSSQQSSCKPFVNVMPRSLKTWKQTRFAERFVPETWRFLVDMLSFHPRGLKKREFQGASWRVDAARPTSPPVPQATTTATAVAVIDPGVANGAPTNDATGSAAPHGPGANRRERKAGKKKAVEYVCALDSVNHMLSVPSNYGVKIPRPQGFVELLERRAHAIRWLLYSNDGPILEGLEFLERFPWVLSGDQTIEYVNDKLDEQCSDSETEEGRVEIVLNRFADPAVWLESLLQQTQVNQKDLHRKFLKIRFNDEPGTGPGPLKEFFELCRILFQTSPLSTTSLMDSVAGVTPSLKSSKKRLKAADNHGNHAPAAASAPQSAESDAAARSSLPTVTELFPLFQPAGDCNPGCVIPVSISTICDRLEKSKQWEDGGEKKSALRGVLELMFESIGFLLAHCIRNEATMGVQLPDIVWAMIIGESRFNWVDFCGADKTLLRSCANLLYQDDVDSLMLTFQSTRSEWVRKPEAPATGSSSGSSSSDTASAPVGSPMLQRNASSSESGSGGGGAVMVAVPVAVDLVEGGAEVEVTKANVLQFVNLMTKLKCLNGCEDSIAAIRSGFSKVIPKKYLQLYYPSALSKVVQSADSIDMAALRGRVEYDSPYHATHRVVRMFWHLVEKELTVEDVRKLLLFWTGSSIVPRDDVEDNKMHIGYLSGGARPSASGKPKLPEASTCHNHLYLPAYGTLDEMRSAIRAVIEFGCIGYDRL